MKYRGSTIEWSTTFKDAAGDAVTPDAAVLRISFPGLTSRRDSTEIELELDDDTGAWVATWDSSEAKPGMVRWSIKAVAGDLLIADDGDFCLFANTANDPSSPTRTSTPLADESGNTLVTEDGQVITS
jgi:hypothetical protein